MFKPGDVISQYEDDHSPLCVDQVVEFNDELVNDPRFGKYSMYAVTEFGMGLTSLDPAKFHLVSEEVKKKYFETLKEYGIYFRKGKNYNFHKIKKHTK